MLPLRIDFVLLLMNSGFLVPWLSSRLFNDLFFLLRELSFPENIAIHCIGVKVKTF